MTTIHINGTVLTTIKSAVKASLPVLMTGETGVGKTAIVAELAKQNKKNLVRVSLNEQVGREDLVGKFGLKDGATVWQDGPVTHAVRNGHWVVLDELNSARPEVLFALHSLLDDAKQVLLHENENELVKAHKGFRVFATINPTSYQGTKQMNSAFMSRFVSVYVQPLPTNQEVEVVTEQGGVDESSAEKLVSLAQELRDKHRNQEIEYFCSTRDLIMAAQIGKQSKSEKLGVIAAILNKLNSDDIEYLSSEGSDLMSYVDKHMSDTDKLKEAKKLNERLSQLTQDIKNIKKQKAKIEENTNAMDDYLTAKKAKAKELDDLVSKKERELRAYEEKTDAEKKQIAQEYLKTLV